VSGDLENKVLDHLRNRGPAKAQDMATGLGADRSAINQLLYGSLRAKVKQDKTYVWSLVASVSNQAAAVPPAKNRDNTYRPLFSYYLDYLVQDDDTGVSVFADSRYDLDYVELETWPFETDEPVDESEAFRRERVTMLNLPRMTYRVAVTRHQSTSRATLRRSRTSSRSGTLRCLKCTKEDRRRATAIF
jgi:hypothetical protein